MDPVTAGLGVLGLGFGGYTSLLRVINPAKLGRGRQAVGPRHVQFGLGIEFLLPNGFPKEAYASAWEMVIA